MYCMHDQHAQVGNCLEFEFISLQFPNVKLQVYKFGNYSHTCRNQFLMCTLELFLLYIKANAINDTDYNCHTTAVEHV